MTFHPRFKKASESHRTRKEKDATAAFYVGQDLKVVSKDRNTIVVSFFDGRAEFTERTLEVVCDEQGEG